MILVTGGTGFIGRYLLQELIARGETVRVIKRPTSHIPLTKEISDKIDWVDGDVLDINSLEEAMQGCDTVYHCAAVVSFLPKKRELMYNVNVKGTANVVNAALQVGVKKLLHVSSIAAIGRSLLDNRITEETPWERSKLNSHYAITKHQSEMEVWRGIAEGLNAVIVNPSVVLGPGDWNKSTCKFFSDSYNGLPGYTDGVTGFVDVRDVVKAMVQLMNSEISEQRFILSAENIAYKDLLFSITDTFGKRRPFIKANRFMSEIAWRLFAVQSAITGKEPLVTKETARVATHQFFFDNNKVKKELGFTFTPIADTIQWTCKEFISQQQLNAKS